MLKYFVMVMALAPVGLAARPAGADETMKLTNQRFGELALRDGDVVLGDGGIHGVQGHTLHIGTDGGATWSRSLDSFSPSGKAGSGATQLSAEEREHVREWSAIAWKLAGKKGSREFYPETSAGIPRRVWIVAMRRGNEIRHVEGGESAGGEPPEKLRPVLAWLVERVDALSAAEASRHTEIADQHTLSHVIVDATHEAYTVVVGVPASATDEQRAQFTATAKDQGFQWLSWEDLQAHVDDVLVSRVSGDDAGKKVQEFLALVQQQPGVPLGLTFDGGIAVTATDYRAAERRHAKKP